MLKSAVADQPSIGKQNFDHHGPNPNGLRKTLTVFPLNLDGLTLMACYLSTRNEFLCVRV